MDSNENISTLVIIVLLAVIVSVFVWFAAVKVNIIVLSGTDGVWDFRELFTEDESYGLSGPVEYIPNALLTPAEFEARKAEVKIGLPQDESKYSTSRIRLLMPDNGHYTFYERSIDYSYRLYINGEWVLDVGRPGDSKESEIPDTGNVSITMKAENGVIEIVQQSSNFVHRLSGDHAGWNISKRNVRTFLSTDFNESIKLGAFLALFFVFALLFVLLPGYRANLYFALFCLLWFFRTGVTGEKIFTDIFPWLPWEIKFRIEYLTLPLMALLFISLLDTLFPLILHKTFRYALYAVSAVVVGLFLFTDTLFMSYALFYCEVLYVPSILYIVVRFAVKLRRIKMEQGVFLAGTALFLLAAVHDMFYYSDHYFLFFRFQQDVSSVSMLLLTFCQAAAMFIVTVRKMETTAAENAVLKQSASLVEKQLVIQRDHFSEIMELVDRDIKARHDIRHHFAVIKRYNKSGESEKLNSYLDELSAEMPTPYEKILCENFAVNALVVYYLGLTQNEGVETETKLEIPAGTGSIPEMDLIVIMGNLLENALNACRRLESGKKYIRLKSRFKAGFLGIEVSNSFNGQYGAEGVGLSSVKAVCEKHRGTLEFEISDNTWKATALVQMEEESKEKIYHE